MRVIAIAVLLTLCFVGIQSASPYLVDLSKLSDFFSLKFKGPLYSGYLNLPNSGKRLHYVFIPSLNDATKDPLALWLQGGPGCSSLSSAFKEIGPVTFPENQKTAYLNPNSWNQNASIIYLESPAGTGFSINSTEAEGTHNDTSVAGDHLDALLQFFADPEFVPFKAREFFIFGHSYGGIYAPYLASKVLAYNNDPQTRLEDRINFKGLWTLAPVTDYTIDAYPSQLEFLWTHGLYGSTLRDQVLANCKDPSTANNPDSKCGQTLNAIKANLNGIDLGNIYNSSTDPDQGLTPFLNNETVRGILNIVPGSPIWAACGSKINYPLNRSTNPASYRFYPELIAAGIKILVASGDVDAMVPTVGTSTWINRLVKQLGLQPVRPWRAYTVPATVAGTPRQQAGMIVEYKGLTYVTFKGAGHLINRYIRYGTQKLFKNFILGRPFDFEDQVLGFMFSIIAWTLSTVNTQNMRKSHTQSLNQRSSKLN
eukprot:TRINITY_DN5351_c0_g1_i10.p1 TRINITY_DN5351_c0_g1~~TRINITY_DN5351_c0_g1_i10.p1  ORF type:complete len:482 (-),score=67.94 TRINITY_DN5351_c0_g1_i10:98-1543(-)